MKVYLNELHSRLKISPSLRFRLSKTLKLFLTEELLPGGEISVILSDDSHLKKLNKQYRKKNKATDVLSFPFQEGSEWRERYKRGDSFILGEIYISLDQAVAQAAEADITAGERITFLLIHGLYHLLGYQHDNDEDYEKMESLVKKLFGRIYNFLR